MDVWGGIASSIDNIDSATVDFPAPLPYLSSSVGDLPAKLVRAIPAFFWALKFTARIDLRNRCSVDKLLSHKYGVASERVVISPSHSPKAYPTRRTVSMTDLSPRTVACALFQPCARGPPRESLRIEKGTPASVPFSVFRVLQAPKVSQA